MPTATRDDLLVALLAILSVVFVAVAASGASAEIGRGTVGPPTGLLVPAEWVGGFLAVGSALVAGSVLLLIRPARRRRAPDEFEPYLEPRKLSWVGLLTLALLAVLAVAAVVTVVRARGAPTASLNAPAGATAPQVPRSGRVPSVTPTAGSRLPPFAWAWFALVIAVVLAVGGAVMISRSWRARGLPAVRDRVARDFAGADDGLEEAAVEAEPRIAVRLSYLLMRRNLAAAGVVFDDSDAPGEYARRAAAAFPDLVDPITRLTGLYERARFSSSSVTDEAKGAALADVRELRSRVLR